MVRAAVVAACLAGTPAYAQSSYVAATIGSDISRFGWVTSRDIDSLSVAGEELALAMRAGTAVAESWGVEVEFVFPSRREVERIQDSSFVVNPTSSNQQGAVSLSFGQIGQRPQFRARVRRRNATAGMTVWLAHGVRERLQLRYLAGIAMHRFEQINNIDVVPQPGLIVSSRAIGETREITYGLGPMTGIEARWMPRGAVFLTIGTRLHGFSAGWILRPSAGAGWSF
jgi:hypothetical protein